ncbi:MAG: DHHA1 domain-containing protein [Candidatus Nanoarchaeia archaeon]|nr:DHHA1 domain-containing protein [Candidatus Nanoarchaeia archaeon]
MRTTLIEVCRDKKVRICSHWDVDGVCSAALIYHLILPHAKRIRTKTKGIPFLITSEDIDDEAEVIICTDIQPSEEICGKGRIIAYIDHHPIEDTSCFDIIIHDPSERSTTTLIYKKLMNNSKDPYVLFLTLAGYFGDGGKNTEIPEPLLSNAKEAIPDMMQEQESHFKEGKYLEIERHVSALNAGKRHNWSGDIPLEMLKSIDNYEPFTNITHPLAVQLQQYKAMLKQDYSKNPEVKQVGKVDCAIITEPRNIQGVLAARLIKERPIMIMNIHGDIIIGSLRVPDSLDFDAGKFLEQFNSEMKTFMGGGHEKAAGFTLSKDELELFIELLKNA